MSQNLDRLSPAVGGYWKRVVIKAARDTELLTRRKALTTLGLIAFREAATAGAHLRSWLDVGQTIGLAILAYLAMTILEYLWHFIRAPALLERTLASEGERLSAELRGSHASLEAVQSQLPTIEVEIDQEDTRSFLVVRNRGKASGTFRADVRLLARTPGMQIERSVFRAYWEEADGPIAVIPPFLQERIYLGSRQYDGLGHSMDLYLYFYDAASRGRAHFIDDSHLIDEPRKTSPFCLVEVTISCEPPMRDGPRILLYRLTLGGLVEESRNGTSPS